MIIPNSAFDYSSMVLQSNKNYVEAGTGFAIPATSAILSTDFAVEPNLIQDKSFFSQESMMQQTSLQDIPLSSSSDAFGWGDFPLLQQSMTLVSSEGASNHQSEQSHSDSSKELSFTYSFDTISSVGSLVSLCSTDVSSEEDSSKRQRRVQFAKVQIREYALTLGDHPWCENGFPLSLDWKFASRQDVSIDDFEHDRMSGECDRSPRRLDIWERRNLLRRVSGYSTSELNGLERSRMLQQQRELMMSSGNDECDLSEQDAVSKKSRMLRHSTTLQNLTSAYV
jgi:hypothetical protein